MDNEEKRDNYPSIWLQGQKYRKEWLDYLKDLEGNYPQDCPGGKDFSGTTRIELEDNNLWWYMMLIMM